MVFNINNHLNQNYFFDHENEDNSLKINYSNNNYNSMNESVVVNNFAVNHQVDIKQNYFDPKTQVNMNKSVIITSFDSKYPEHFLYSQKINNNYFPIVEEEASINPF